MTSEEGSGYLNILNSRKETWKPEWMGLNFQTNNRIYRSTGTFHAIFTANKDPPSSTSALAHLTVAFPRSGRKARRASASGAETARHRRTTTDSGTEGGGIGFYRLEASTENTWPFNSPEMGTADETELHDLRRTTGERFVAFEKGHSNREAYVKCCTLHNRCRLSTLFRIIAQVRVLLGTR